jgi:LacI family transcriptional regulator
VVTMADVAKKLGLSMMTISRVINNKGNVKDDTREKVLQTIKEMKYYPSSIGRGLISSRLNTIGILAPYQGIIYENPYYAEIITGVEKACIKYSYDILLATYKMREDEVDYLKLYHERKVDGVIVVVPDLNNPQMKDMEVENVPSVVIGERPVSNIISYIDTDNKMAAFNAAEYLIRNGHKDIAFLKGIENNRNSIDRFEGFKTAMEKNNLSVKPEWVFDGDFLYNSGRETGKKVMKLSKLPSAIICSNDLMALGLLAELNSQGIKIPEQLSIVGFDGIPAGRYIHPVITSWRQPLVDMGFKAAEILFKKIKEPEARQEIFIYPLEMLPGESVKDLN